MLKYNELFEKYDEEKEIKGYGKLKYLNAKSIDANTDVKVIGCIGDVKGFNVGDFEVNGRKKPYFSKQQMTNKFKVIGYIKVNEIEWIAIVKKKRLGIILTATLIPIVVVFLGLVFLQMSDSNIDPLAKDYTPPENLNIKADPDHIIVPGFETVRMEAGTDNVYMALWNPESNPCYFQFTLIDSKTNKELFQSGLIPPGKAITELKLANKIKVGEYDMSLKIDTYSLKDEKTPLNGSVVNFKLLAIK